MCHNYCVITIFLEQPLQTPPVPQSSPRACLAPHLAPKSLRGSLGVPQARLQLWLCQTRGVCPQPPVDQGSLLLRHSVHHRECLVAGWCLAKQDKLFQGLRMLLRRAGAGEGAEGSTRKCFSSCDNLVLTELRAVELSASLCLQLLLGSFISPSEDLDGLGP